MFLFPLKLPKFVGVGPAATELLLFFLVKEDKCTLDNFY